MKKNIISGIYCYENLINGKKYIGQSLNIHKRQIHHYLNQGMDGCSALQGAWNKYGCENFKFYILIECVSDKKLLNKLEIFYIKYLRSHVSEWGYNISWGGDLGNTGIKHTDEAKKKNSIAHMGRATWMKGKKHSNEAKLKQSLAKKGRPSNNKGKKASDETRRKQSLAKKGKPISKATTEGSIKAHKGVPKSEEQRRKMSESQIFTKKRKNPSSKHIGVYYEKGKNRWRSYLKYNNKDITLGYFPTELEAALAYNEAAIEFYGWKAKLNNISKEEIEILWEMQIETQ